MIDTIGIDTMMTDIVTIFNMEGVELVRLSGLYTRENKFTKIMPEELDKIIHKLKKASIIDYKYILYCPHCADVMYIIKPPTNPFSPKVCDTCKTIYTPEKDISMFEYNEYLP